MGVKLSNFKAFVTPILMNAEAEVTDADNSATERDEPIRRPRRPLYTPRSPQCSNDVTDGADEAKNDTGLIKDGHLSELDRSLIAVPYEVGLSNMRELEHLMEKELLLIASYLSKRLVLLESHDIVLEKLQRALERLQRLDSSLRRIDASLETVTSQLSARIDTFHTESSLGTGKVDNKFCFDDYRQRVAWVVSEYLLRRGYLSAATPYVAQEQLNMLVDTDLHATVDRIYRELLDRQLSGALEWAEANYETLVKLDSTLLEDIKVQQVIMRLQDEDVTGAISLLKSFGSAMLERCEDSRKLFSAIVLLKVTHQRRQGNVEPVDSQDPDQVPGSTEMGDRTDDNSSQDMHEQNAPATPTQSNEDPETDSDDTTPQLICIYCDETVNSECEICNHYTDLTSPDRWDSLAAEFYRCIVSIYNLGQQTLLENLMHTGFCAIKSTSCADHRNATCPACLPEWRQYVDKVPTTTKLDSVLVCPVTGDVMGYDNAPFTSPGGCVISEHGLNTLIRSGDGKQVECPQTRLMVPKEDFTKLFIT
ncbi:MACROPHAGE ERYTHROBLAST ATTACHER-RELATED, putative [Babesia bigemina]|uniref:MACROPHAGE ERYTHROBLAST ATTACHER-RELATED, putative n=1 Tax=Babesia bigemina TaxID=5866 RepID=A0A061DBC4_BABBI|nr:MACROPHAGE ERYTHROBLAST ATTACHER-RELATED, putative [Babesia bigemina]CDR97272.1 MACROPHAGE ERYTHROBLAST ATTACHER-RELATED, putative [Babesia bigemina]|eukprot:XP_012769458.1 MACROPHAGE ERYTHROBLAST ATTACHER-RELATED, putative [Babesia bigemina]